LKQYVEVAKGDPARQTKLARTAAFDRLAAERYLAFDFCRGSESAIAAGVFMNNAG
jgi:hypothetical protein